MRKRRQSQSAATAAAPKKNRALDREMCAQLSMLSEVAGLLARRIDAGLRVELVNANAEISFPADGHISCPQCDCIMTFEAAARGFSAREPADFSTRCPECARRFLAMRTVRVGRYRDDFVWLGKVQAAAALAHWESHHDPRTLVLDQPSLAWNFMLHRLGDEN